MAKNRVLTLIYMYVAQSRILAASSGLDMLTQPEARLLDHILEACETALGCQLASCYEAIRIATRTKRWPHPPSSADSVLQS